MSDRRLIEDAFPLRETSVASVHEKNVRHGHISTLHIWPARRPLAACRAALIAALLQSPDNEADRAALCKRIGGRIETDADGKAKVKDGILSWGNENKPDLQFFRDAIKAANGGTAPKVLDMFAGGGAIPLEAMRLGCDVTAVDYNPVAWFLLKCTLEYPSKLAGKTWKLPQSETPIPKEAQTVAAEFAAPENRGDLAAHVRYWGNWVLERARVALKDYYPTLPLHPDEPSGATNPLCPTVAYLWARTVPHPDPQKNGLLVPLLKTLWLCKKPKKKRALRIHYNASANQYDFEVFTPVQDSEVGAGTMSRGGVQAPATHNSEVGSHFSMDYLKECGKAGTMGAVCTAVVVDVPHVRGLPQGENVGKEYRAPTDSEREAAKWAAKELPRLENEIPFGLPKEPLSPEGNLGFRVPLYGMNTWDKLFTPRQLLALGTFVRETRAARAAMSDAYAGLPDGERELLAEAVQAYLGVVTDRLADYSSSITHWSMSRETIANTYSRFALPMSWDFSETVLTGKTTGGYAGALEWVWKVIEHICIASEHHNTAVMNQSAVVPLGENVYDVIATDPPYYDAIPYADLSDFFYVWLRRTVGDTYKEQFTTSVTAKSGELVQHAARHPTLKDAKRFYEEGMEQTFRMACRALKPDGRMVIVFAHKNPAAWETLLGAIIRSGFVVTASWPIDTEMTNRSSAQGNAALASSVWLVCRKRPTESKRGWQQRVRQEMQSRIAECLRNFWDQGIRGPDLIWSAIGPGLEAYSAWDRVTDNTGNEMTVTKFLEEVRRQVTDWMLTLVLHGEGAGVDDWTRYALVHMQNFGDAGAPVGECILLSGAYTIDLNALTGARGLLAKGKAKRVKDDEDAEEEEAEPGGKGGNDLRLLHWNERTRDDLGMAQNGIEPPLVDRLHRLMREWKTGSSSNAAWYISERNLGTNELFWRVAQAFAELRPAGDSERAMLEAIITFGKGRTIAPGTYIRNTQEPTPAKVNPQLRMELEIEE